MSRPAVLAVLLCAHAAAAQDAPLLEILKNELERNFQALKQNADPPPYFLSYSVVQQQTTLIAGTLGTLQTQNQNTSRFLDVSVRVGSPELDNYHMTRGERPQFTSATLLPFEDGADAIRRRLWSETDRTYRLASQRLINLKTSTQVSVESKDKSADFSREEPVTFSDSGPPAPPPPDAWIEKVRKWSGEFAKYPGALASGVSVRLQSETRHLVNSEGTSLQHGRGFARISIVAQGKAADGMDVSASDSFDAETAKGLPADAAITAAVNRVGERLNSLLAAPLVEPFVGPAILSGEAAGVFFHEIFGHRVEGHRQRDETDGQTFTASVNSSVLPEFLSVIFDPTRKQADGIDLNGTYQFDDEGVKARRVPVVENGILKTFLMSRTPIANFPRSNGHGRKQPGAEVVSRQSNLLVESSKSVPQAELRKMLIDEVKRQSKPYGLFFEQVTGGFTTTGRRGFQSFKVIPVVVYRVYPDGRPDQLVRGVDIVGTPLSSFSRIAATSDKPAVFNGFCGAESGSVPVSAVSPAILVTELEIQKREKGNDRPPLLPPPPSGALD